MPEVKLVKPCLRKAEEMGHRSIACDRIFPKKRMLLNICITPSKTNSTPPSCRVAKKRACTKVFGSSLKEGKW